MAGKEGKLAPQILDEIWTLMRYATVTREDSQQSSDDFINVMPDHFRWECNVADTDGSDTETENSDDLIKDDGTHDDTVIHEAADSLAAMGDKYCEKSEQEKLVTDITKYLQSVSNRIDDQLGRLLGNTRPSDEVFRNTIFSAAYSTFKSKLLSFLGVNETVDRIAVVTHITRGIAAGFKSSDQQTLNLISALAFKFVSDRYSNTLTKYDSVKSLAESAKEPQDQVE